MRNKTDIISSTPYMHFFAVIGSWLMIPILAIAAFFGIHSGSVQNNPPSSSTTTPSSTSTSSSQSASSTSVIELDSATPASGAPGDTITLRGSGFTGSNKVLLNGGLAANDAHLSSVTNGHQEIIFTLPSSLTADCKAGHACPMYVILLTSGFYQLSVENDNGVSTSIPFEVVGGVVVPAP